MCSDIQLVDHNGAAISLADLLAGGSEVTGCSVLYRTKLSSMYEGGFLLARLVKICTENFADRNKISEIKVCSLYWPGLLRCYVKSGSFLTY